jgi:hypothetical protein
MAPQSVYDVIVAGGGSAGVAAAVAAAREGADVLLVEQAGCLGGASTMRNVVTYCGLYTLADEPERAVGGIADEVTDRLATLEALSAITRHRGVFVVFEPEAVKVVLDDICEDAGVTVALGATIIAARRHTAQIASIEVVGQGTQQRFSARAFVDATGDANLASLGGAAVRYGNDGEVNLGSMGTRFGGISPTVEVTATAFAAAVNDLPEGLRGQVTKDRSIIARLPISGDLVCYVASVDYDARDILSYSGAERSGRRQAWVYLQALRTLPGCEAAYLVSTGPQFGTRESRHIESDRQLTWDDIEQRHQFDDCVALGAWGAEWHSRADYSSTFDYPPDRRAFEIPLRCLHSRDTQNLWGAGRLVDGDKRAGAAARVMGTSFATGQAAGIAASVFANDESVDAELVRNALRRQGALISPVDLHPLHVGDQ